MLLLVCRAQELCESGGGRPGLPVPNSPHGPCGRKATLNLNHSNSEVASCVKVKVAVLDLDHVALRPQKRGCLLGTGTGGMGLSLIHI